MIPANVHVCTYIELLLVTCLSINHIWCLQLLHVVGEVVDRYFCTTSCDSFQDGIMKEDILGLEWKGEGGAGEGHVGRKGREREEGRKEEKRVKVVWRRFWKINELGHFCSLQSEPFGSSAASFEEQN